MQLFIYENVSKTVQRFRLNHSLTASITIQRMFGNRPKQAKMDRASTKNGLRMRNIHFPSELYIWKRFVSQAMQLYQVSLFL